MAQKIGILGGTFNPIHFGHLAAAEEIRDHLKLERVLFVPSFLPPHKNEEDMPSAVQRLEMVRMAVSGNTMFRVSDVEVKRGGRSYTIETIEAMQQAHPGAEFYFITGLDSFLDIQTWNQWERLLTLCCFVVLSRPGYRFSDLVKIDFLKHAADILRGLDSGAGAHAVIQTGAGMVCLETIPLYDISSTDIRRRVREGRSIKYHLPDSVEKYIIDNKLYA